jgi:hypothetical protein
MDDSIDRFATLLARLIARRWISKCAEQETVRQKERPATDEQDHRPEEPPVEAEDVS